VSLLERYDSDSIFRLWEQQPQFTLCRDTGLEARDGQCVAHGGDACLHQYVQVTALVRAFEKAVGTPPEEPTC